MAAVTLMAFSDKGQLWFDEPGRFAGLIAKYRGERLRVTIEKPPPLRTLQQNAKLWATYDDAAKQMKEQLYDQGCVGMAEWSGHTKEEVHEGMKQLYCPEKPVTLPGGRVVMVKSTKLLDVPEMSEFIERCMSDFAQNGIRVA